VSDWEIEKMNSRLSRSILAALLLGGLQFTFELEYRCHGSTLPSSWWVFALKVCGSIALVFISTYWIAIPRMYHLKERFKKTRHLDAADLGALIGVCTTLFLYFIVTSLVPVIIAIEGRRG
jgi:hypothetical protein